MAYPYVRTTWVDRQVQNPMNFTVTGTAAVTQGGSLVLTPNEGSVTQTGTALTASVMNNIEQGIVDLDNNKLDKTGGTVSGLTTFSAGLASEASMSVKGGINLKNSLWTGDDGVIYKNSNSSSNNYGIVLGTGRLLDNSQGSTLSIGNGVSRNLAFAPTSGGTAYEVMHRGNSNYASLDRKNLTLGSSPNVSAINTDWLITDGTNPWTFTSIESGLYRIDVTAIYIMAATWVASATAELFFWTGAVGTGVKRWLSLDVGNLSPSQSVTRSNTVEMYIPSGTTINITLRHSSTGVSPLAVRGFSQASTFVVQQITRG